MRTKRTGPAWSCNRLLSLRTILPSQLPRLAAKMLSTCREVATPDRTSSVAIRVDLIIQYRVEHVAIDGASRSSRAAVQSEVERLCRRSLSSPLIISAEVLRSQFAEHSEDLSPLESKVGHSPTTTARYLPLTSAGAQSNNSTYTPSQPSPPVSPKADTPASRPEPQASLQHEACRPTSLPSVVGSIISKDSPSAPDQLKLARTARAHLQVCARTGPDQMMPQRRDARRQDPNAQARATTCGPR